MGRPPSSDKKIERIEIRCSIKTRIDWKILAGHHKTSEEALRFYIDNYEQLVSMLKYTPKGVGKLY